MNSPEKLPKKILFLFIKQLRKRLDSDPDPSQVDVYEKKQIRDEIKLICNAMSLKTPEWYEYGFYWLLYSYNMDIDNYNNLKIPEKYMCKYDIDVNVVFYTTETYSFETYTYYKRDSSSKTMISNDDNLDIYGGELSHSETYDSETGDWEVKDVYCEPINESTRKSKVISEEKKRKYDDLIRKRNEIDNKIKNLFI